MASRDHKYTFQVSLPLPSLLHLQEHRVWGPRTNFSLVEEDMELYLT